MTKPELIDTIQLLFGLGRYKRLRPNGRVYERFAGPEMPYLMREADGSISELSQKDRAMLRFTRALPESLLQEFAYALDAAGGRSDEFGRRMQTFLDHCERRVEEIHVPC